MALLNKVVASIPHGNGRIVVVKTTFDASYTTGGMSLVPSDVGMYGFSAVVPSPLKSGFDVQWDADAQKLVVYGTGAADKAAGTEQDAATDLSALSCQLIIFGS